MRTIQGEGNGEKLSAIGFPEKRSELCRCESKYCVEFNVSYNLPSPRRRNWEIRKESHRISGEKAQKEIRRARLPNHCYYDQRIQVVKMRHDSENFRWQTSSLWAQRLSACDLRSTMAMARHSKDGDETSRILSIRLWSEVRECLRQSVSLWADT